MWQRAANVVEFLQRQGSEPLAVFPTFNPTIMANFNSVEYRVPAHWISAIVNGDETSFTFYADQKDYMAYIRFAENEVLDATVEVSSEAYFATCHGATGYGVAACDVVDCIFHYPVGTDL